MVEEHCRGGALWWGSTVVKEHCDTQRDIPEHSIAAIHSLENMGEQELALAVTCL